MIQSGPRVVFRDYIEMHKQKKEWMRQIRKAHGTLNFYDLLCKDSYGF